MYIKVTFLFQIGIVYLANVGVKSGQGRKMKDFFNRSEAAPVLRGSICQNTILGPMMSMKKPEQLQFPLPEYKQHSRRIIKKIESRCVYCGAKATTRDHVPPKCFLEKPFPANLLTVPSCQPCNVAWSKDEEYFLVILANVGGTNALKKKLDPPVMGSCGEVLCSGGVVERGLWRNAKLDERIIQSLSVDDSGRVLIEPEEDRLKRVAEKIACGLFWGRYGNSPLLSMFKSINICGPGSDIPINIRNAAYYGLGGRRKKWIDIQGNVFSYLFAKGDLIVDPPLYCLLNIHSTFLFSVCCPSPNKGKRRIMRG